MTTLEVLRKARALLVQRGWTQGAFARCGRAHASARVHYGSANAACFCAVGAVYAAACPDGIDVRDDAVQALERALTPEDSFMTIPSYNDAERRTAGEVLAVFDRAIEASR